MRQAEGQKCYFSAPAAARRASRGPRGRQAGWYSQIGSSAIILPEATLASARQPPQKSENLQIPHLPPSSRASRNVSNATADSQISENGVSRTLPADSSR